MRSTIAVALQTDLLTLTVFKVVRICSVKLFFFEVSRSNIVAHTVVI